MNPEQLLDKYISTFGYGPEAKSVLNEGGGFILPLWTEFDDPLIYTKYTQEDVNNILSHLSTITHYFLLPGSEDSMVYLDERGLCISIPAINTKGWLIILSCLKEVLINYDFLVLNWKLCDANGNIIEWWE